MWLFPALTFGCAPEPFVEVADFGSNPGALTMYEHIPAADGPMPLLVVLHGCLTDHSFADNAGYLALSDARGFALVAVEQRLTNNPDRCFSWYDAVDTAREGGEAESVAQMIASVEARVDVSGVGVTGVSAGAAMANAVVARWPDLVDVGVIDAGVPLGCAGSLAEAAACMAGPPDLTDAEWGAEVTDGADGPWPRVMVVQGSADPVVVPADGDALVTQWLAVHGRSGEQGSVTTFSTDRGPATDTVFGDGVVESLRYEGLGHEVPVDEPAGCGDPGPFVVDIGDCLAERVVAFLDPALAAPDEGAAR